MDVVVGAKVSEQFGKAVRVRAAERGLDVSEVVRIALKEWMERAQEPREVRAARVRSEVAKVIAGSLDRIAG